MTDDPEETAAIPAQRTEKMVPAAGHHRGRRLRCR